jgi:hypothetical protein
MGPCHMRLIRLSYVTVGKVITLNKASIEGKNNTLPPCTDPISCCLITSLSPPKPLTKSNRTWKEKWDNQIWKANLHIKHAWYVLFLTEDHSHPSKIQAFSTSLWTAIRCLLKAATLLQILHDFSQFRLIFGNDLKSCPN